MANGKPMTGPGGPRGRRGMQKPKNAGQTIARLLGYMSGQKYLLILVFVGIMCSSLAGVAGTYFLKPVINSIEEGLSSGSFDVRAFAMKLVLMACVYAVGAAGAYLYSRLMMNISTETMRKIRVDTFGRLQSLPIKYFDTHTHGEIMSRFTNDTDTLREMLSQGIPQMFSSSVTIIGVFVLMCILSPVLTALIVVMVFVITFVVKKIGVQSAKYFKRQQKAIGAVNGYIEEMI